MANITLENIASSTETSKLNTNFQRLADALNNRVLYRSPVSGEPNQMVATLDMNGQRIYNLPVPIGMNEPARLADVVNYSGSASHTYAEWGNIAGTITNQADLIGRLNLKQNTLVSGTTLRTINGQSLLGSGNINVAASGGSVWGSITGNIMLQSDLVTLLGQKQNTLISGSNIRTINGQSLVGSGNIVIEGGSSEVPPEFQALVNSCIAEAYIAQQAAQEAFILAQSAQNNASVANGAATQAQNTANTVSNEVNNGTTSRVVKSMTGAYNGEPFPIGGVAFAHPVGTLLIEQGSTYTGAQLAIRIGGAIYPINEGSWLAVGSSRIQGDTQPFLRVG